MHLEQLIPAPRLRSCAAAILFTAAASLTASGAAAVRKPPTPAQNALAQKEYAIGLAAYNHGDWPAAEQHLRRAAKLGNTKALVALGDGYASEVFGSRRTQVLAITFYRAAVKRDDPSGMERLGFAYLTGEYGVHQDYPKAEKWLRRSAAKGDSDAMVDLGNMYCTGNGVDKNVDKAHIWYARAARAGNSNAREWWHEHSLDAVRGITRTPPAQGMFPGPCMTVQPQTLGTMGSHIERFRKSDRKN